MDVIIRVRPELGLALHGRQVSSSESEQLLQTAKELGVTLSPMHPSTEDPSLASYFIIEVRERATAEQVIARLSHSHGVEAAYLKPPDELP